MTPEDRHLAREALVSGRLTIEQVSALRDECEKTGKPFAELAGLSSREDTGGKHRDPFPILILCSALLITGLLVATVVRMISSNQAKGDRAQEYNQMVYDTENLERQTRTQYERKQVTLRDATAHEALKKARAAMVFVEERREEAAGEPDLYVKLVQATLSYSTYLGIYPNDSAILLERAHAWDLLNNPERALKDLDRAVELDPALDAKVGDRVAELRLKLSR